MKCMTASMMLLASIIPAAIAAGAVAKPGQGVIRIWGRRIGRDAPSFGSPTVIEHRVTIR